MAREGRSHVRKRRRGCLSGCLTNILLILGLAALLFVGACVLGFVKNDPETGAPSLSLGGLTGLELPEISLPEGLTNVTLPDWAYGVNKTGLTVKTLRAGSGEAVLVCADGYTMLLGGGSGMGAALTGQLLLCGVSHLNAAAAMSSDQSQIGGLPLAITLMPPQYLLFQDSQTKGTAYNRLIAQAQRNSGIQAIVPTQGLSFALGRARVTFIGPARTAHTDERDDGLSVRIDYGNTSVLIMGSITAGGERELISSRVNLDADALICALGGSEEATCAELVSAVSPDIALMTGKNPANAVKVRLTRAGAQVYTAREHGVMTLVSDGETIQIKP
ncbi:MAG: ComEC/Rec2 family competence protein [Candidatus Ventricola sp.]